MAPKSKVEEEKKKREEIERTVIGAIGILLVLIVLLVAGVAYGSDYIKISQSRIYVEKSEINAPIISLGPASPGILEKIFVSEGDKVRENMILAKVGDGYMHARTDGLVISVQNTPGQFVNAQTPVVKMIDPREFRVIGRVEEDKGLKDIMPGQRVIFTVDAFGSKQYEGIVDTISPASRDSDIVFSISDKREKKQFNVKATYDVDAYPELKNGMSARMWIYK